MKMTKLHTRFSIRCCKIYQNVLVKYPDRLVHSIYQSKSYKQKANLTSLVRELLNQKRKSIDATKAKQSEKKVEQDTAIHRIRKTHNDHTMKNTCHSRIQITSNCVCKFSTCRFINLNWCSPAFYANAKSNGFSEPAAQHNMWLKFVIRDFLQLKTLEF